MLESLRLDGAEILVVSPTPTWPLDHGNRKRIFSTCSALKERGAIIHFLHYPSEGDWRGSYPKRAMQVMQEQWDYCYRVTPTVPLHVSAKGDSHLIDEWWDEAIENEIKWLSDVNNFDAIIVNYSWLSKALEFVPQGCLKVLDTHDRFSNRGELLQQHGIKKEFFHTTQHEETKALVRANIVWAIKHGEEEFFRKLLQDYDYDEAIKEAKEAEERALRIKGIVLDPEELEIEKDYHINKDTVVKTMLYVEDKDGFTFQAPCIHSNYLTIGMVGAYNNINLVNTRAFLEVALPIFEKYMVPVKILLAGSMCRGLQDLNHPFVEQLGRVESLDDFYVALDIALVPMTFSTGLKIKAGEALAYGVPLMAHKHAYEGYPVYHKWQEMDSLEDIAMAIVVAAQDYKEVEHLRVASEKAQLSLHGEVSQTLDHFASTIKEHLKIAVVVLPKLCLGDYSLKKLKIEQVSKNLNSEYRVIFYYPFELTSDIEAFLETKSSIGVVACLDKTTKSSQLWSGVDLTDIHKIWQFRLLWNISGIGIEKKDFEKDFWYFYDKSFSKATQMKIASDCDILVQSAVRKKSKDESFLDWYESPLAGRIEDIYEGLWQEQPADKSQAIYMMLSGTKEQIYFWHKIYSMMLEDSYKLYWIIDSQEVDWHIENRLDPVEISRNYLELGEAARCGIMVNIARSNLLSTIAWTLFICKRRIYDAEEVPNEKGALKLSTLYREMKRSVEELDLNDYSNRFQHNAYRGLNFEQICYQLQQKKVSLCLPKKEKKIIVFIAVGRTGSNYLSRLLDNHFLFFNAYELFNNECIYALNNKLLDYAHYVKKDFNEICDKKLVDYVHAFPEALIDFFKSIIDFDTEKEYFTFKIFPEHLVFENVQKILKRADVKIVFLKREPIASYISELKAWESGKWKNYNHTDIKPSIDFNNYVKWYTQKEKWYTEINDFMIRHNKKITTLYYDEFTKADDYTNLKYILANIIDDNQYKNNMNNIEIKYSMSRQDKSKRVEEKVKNWDEFYSIATTKDWHNKLFTHFNE